jgi:AcrR family transcriptional regulator
MVQKWLDPRAIYTRQKIQESFMQLLETQRFEQITVRDITKKAYINRATFYHHYEDKYDLVVRLFEEAIQKFAQHLDSPPIDLGMTNPEQPSKGIVQAFEHIAEHERFYRTMLGENGSPWFITHLCAAIKKLSHERLRMVSQTPHEQRMPSEVAIGLASHFFVGAIMWWLHQENPVAPCQMAIWFLQFVSRGYYDVLGFSIPPGPENRS